MLIMLCFLLVIEASHILKKEYAEFIIKMRIIYIKMITSERKLQTYFLVLKNIVGSGSLI